MIQVRRALPLDMDALAAVLRDAFLEFRPLYSAAAFAVTTLDSDELSRRLDEGPIWVAVLRGKIAGTISAVEKPDGVYVRSTAVVPAARGNHIAEALLEEVESFAVQCGADRIFLSTTPFLHAAIHIYEKSGFHLSTAPPHDLCGTPLFTMEKKLH